MPKKNKSLKLKESSSLPSFMNYIFYNKMVGNQVEEKLFKYSKTEKRIFGRTNKTTPISKIISLKNRDEI